VEEWVITDIAGLTLLNRIHNVKDCLNLICVTEGYRYRETIQKMAVRSEQAAD